MTKTEKLREGITQKIYSMNRITPMAMARPCTWDELLECTRENFHKQADQILKACKEAGLVFETGEMSAGYHQITEEIEI